jgi:probable HAF family extracellular repeat protein
MLVPGLMLMLLNWTPTLAQSPGYTATDLGMLPGDWYSSAGAINGNGYVVGNSYGPNGVNGFVWKQEAGIRAIGLNQASGINSEGEVVGTAGSDAALWKDGAGVQLLPKLSGVYQNYGSAINDKRQVVGYGAVNGGQLAWIWEDGVGVQDLGSLPGALRTVPAAINSKGQVVGQAWTATDSSAWIWDADNGMRDLGKLVGTSICGASGINDAGQVVGTCNTPALNRAWIWIKGTGLEELPTLPGGSFSVVGGINNAGQVVGQASASNGGSHPVVWLDPAHISMLPEFPDSPFGGTAGSINASDLMAGSLWTVDGFPHAVLWQPAAATPAVAIHGVPIQPITPGTLISLNADVAMGTPPFTYAWTKNGVAFGTGSQITDGPTADATYAVTVIDHLNLISNIAQVTVAVSSDGSCDTPSCLTGPGLGATPELSSIALFGSGIAALAGYAAHRRRRPMN